MLSLLGSIKWVRQLLLLTLPSSLTNPCLPMWYHSNGNMPLLHQSQKLLSTKPTQCSDFRPISVTSVLSRLTERYVVRSFIYPALLHPPPSLCFSDQFAFRPSGSTTVALVALLHTICDMLSTNSFVYVIALGFSKAFDSVRHSTLINKMAQLAMHYQVHNWIRLFLRALPLCQVCWVRLFSCGHYS